MAQLNSPGVAVTVIDESFYTPAAPGTTPLIIVASAENKANSSATGTAKGTLKANAGQVYLLTSQKDLGDTFGIPTFKTDANNNPIHAGEQNEYGLQTAYSYLGSSNRAYVVRADLDLAQLNATTTAPVGEADNGTVWFDTASTLYGVFQWNAASASTAGGQTFGVKTPTIITDVTKLVNDSASEAPKSSFGKVGDYAVVATTKLVRLYYKKPTTDTPAGTWVLVGSPEWRASWPTVQATANATLNTNHTLVVNGESFTSVTSLTTLATEINNSTGLDTAGVKAAVINGRLELYSTGVAITIGGTSAADLGIATKAYAAPFVQISPHYSIPEFKSSDATPRPTGSVWIKTTTPNLGADWIVKKYSSSAAAWQSIKAPIYTDSAKAFVGLDANGGGINLALDTMYVKANDDFDFASPDNCPSVTFKIYKRSSVGVTTITSAALTGTSVFGTQADTFTFNISVSEKGSSTYTSNSLTVTFNVDGSSTDAANAEYFVTGLASALSTAGITAVTASFNSTTNRISITHTEGGDIRFFDTDGKIELLFADSANFVAAPQNAYEDFVATLWTDNLNANNLGAVASSVAPSSIPADGRLWYNSTVSEVDIMIHDGTTWVGYLNGDIPALGGPTTDPAGPIVSATKPTAQSDGTELANGDLWIDSSDTENYPKIYRYNYTTKKWVAVDKTDQVSENGILFHDARWSSAGADVDPASIVDLLSSDYLDPDAPDPALYPKGMLLWNLRRSGNNVKKFVQNYVDTTTGSRNSRFGSGDGELMEDYYPHRWVSVASNNEDGTGAFGRKSQRKVVVQALQALVNSNQQIRDEESRVFNLIACPGYPELINEMVSLNVDRGLTSFVVGDTPARLSASATALSNWGNNVAGAVENGDDGLVTSDEYLGVFYPWGYTSDNLGNNIVVPPSHMILKTIAMNDQVAYPWFAPAGTRRGAITNATAVGYIDATTGEFQSVALNTGQRDTLASIKVNPITFITGTGLVNYGQYTRAKNASALDRINVARLVVELRRRFAQLAKPYVFEPNDKITRDELKGAAESILLELVGQRALYDYIVVCDTTNNTPARIDRNELYLDVAIEPVKAVEFIYIPLRLKNTGEIAALGQ
jgi:phage tail sheath protein FI